MSRVDLSKANYHEIALFRKAMIAAGIVLIGEGRHEGLRAFSCLLDNGGDFFYC